MPAGRKSRLNDPEFAKAVAEAYVGGVSRDEMAELLGCHRDSLTTWVRDPRVQAHAIRLTRERIARITRRIDAEVEGRLAHVSNWELQDLLKVRKEFLERSLLPAEAGANAADATEELVEAMDQNPELADALTELVKGGSTKQ